MRTTLLSALMMLGIFHTAQGDMVIQTVSTGSALSTDFNVNLTISPFNKSLGTLTGIQISYTDQANISGTLSNTSATPQTFTVTENVAFTLSLGSSTLLSNTLTASNTYTNLAPNTPASFGPFVENGSVGATTYTSGSTFNTFANATSPILLGFGTLTSNSFKGGGGNVSSNITTTAQGMITVEYDYVSNSNPNTSVPEPASLAMTGMGGLLIAGAGWLRARRRDHARA